MNIFTSHSKSYQTVIKLSLLTVLASRINWREQCISLVEAAFIKVHEMENVEEYNQQVGYTQGNWVPVEHELSNHQVVMSARIPAELQGGMFVRMGTNAKVWPPTSVHHPFNGESMMHRIVIGGNYSIEYSNNYVEEESRFQLADFRNESIPEEEGMFSYSYGDVNHGGFALLKIILVKIRNALKGIKPNPMEKRSPGSTSLITHGNKAYTATETVMPFQVEISKDQVSGTGFIDFDGALNNQTAAGPSGTMSPHPKIDPITGQMFFFAANYDVPNFVNFGAINKYGNPERYLQIPVPSKAAAFYHDMFLTETFAIVPHSSLKKDSARLAKGLGVNYFDNSQMLAFGVLPRNASSADEMIWINSTSPGHIWHTVAAKEDGDILTLYAPKFNSYSDEIFIHLPVEEPSYLTKFTINLTDKTCTEEIIFDEVVERPTVNNNILSPRYVYLRSEGSDSSEMGRKAVKFDLETEQVIGSVDCGQVCHLGEPLFVARANAVSEDDGFIVDIPYYPETHSSKFLIWDAQQMENAAPIVGDLPQRVPYGAHGKWLEPEFFSTTKSF